MSRQSVTFFDFKGGLNTEATPLNIPPSDATEMVNVVINQNGSIERRPGVDTFGKSDSDAYAETDTTDLTGIVDDQYYDPTPSMIQFTPTDSSGNPSPHVVVHVNETLYIYQLLNDASLVNVDNPITTVDLSAYSSKQALVKTKFIIDRNKLFILNKFIPLGYVEFSAVTDLFSILTVVPICKRDLSGSADIDSYVNNDGKNYICIKSHTSGSTTEPGVGASWQTYWVINGHEDTNYDSWVTATAYTSNINQLTFITTAVGWDTGVFAKGRLWIAGNSENSNSLLYSQTVSEDTHYGRFYQFADPFNKNDTEVVETDGGEIRITGIEHIVNIIEFRSGILVFATNGVWFIYGPSGPFYPTDYTIQKISEDGIVGHDAATVVEDHAIYFGQSAGYIITGQEDVDGIPTLKEFTTKIKTLYADIVPFNKQTSKVVYDRLNKKIYFLCNVYEHSWRSDRNKYNRCTQIRDILIFDTALSAWYQYSLAEDATGDSMAIADIAILKAGGSNAFLEVQTALGDTVTDESANTVYVYSGSSITTTLGTYCLFIQKNDDNIDFAFGKLEGSTYADFSSYPDNTAYYDSTVMTAYQTFGDIIHQKQAPCMTTIFDRITDSSCFMRVDWDWSTNTNSGKYGTARQMYSPDKHLTNKYFYDTEDSDVVQTKHKIRGRGTVLRIYFEGEDDKPFKLYGWQMVVTARKRD